MSKSHDIEAADINYTTATLHDTVVAIVRQSHAIHPDWTLDTHLAYLQGEEEIDPEALTTWHGWVTGWHAATVREVAAATLAVLSQS